MFATGGSDKQIHIWKYKDNNGNSDEIENQYDGLPDFEMVDEHPTKQELVDEEFF